ncbi:hypothetical protein ACFSUD_07790 [Sulfitobacter aestuarii]|uniref:DUF202 domain-containing protein n=1 Tax=Sulfitobacter aestuarii TaxID=2161676 RepID=A0ABW5U248_9RHOB
MSDIGRNQESAEFREEADSLWRLTLGPLVWALHFVISYGATALVCARIAGSAEAVALLRLGIGALTLLAVALILWLGWRSWRQWDVIRDRDWENDQGHSEDRHQFMGHAGFLLAVISLIGVVYVALPVLLIGSCA